MCLCTHAFACMSIRCDININYIKGSVTHTSRSDKTSITVSWTSPPVGTGAITIGYATTMESQNSMLYNIINDIVFPGLLWCKQGQCIGLTKELSRYLREVGHTVRHYHDIDDDTFFSHV
jgi:hypothetical protein